MCYTNNGTNIISKDNNEDIGKHKEDIQREKKKQSIKIVIS